MGVSEEERTMSDEDARKALTVVRRALRERNDNFLGRVGRLGRQELKEALKEVGRAISGCRELQERHNEGDAVLSPKSLRALLETLDAAESLIGSVITALQLPLD
jgi:hypothetical protein